MQSRNQDKVLHYTKFFLFFGNNETKAWRTETDRPLHCTEQLRPLEAGNADAIIIGQDPTRFSKRNKKREGQRTKYVVGEREGVPYYNSIKQQSWASTNGTNKRLKKNCTDIT